MTVSQLIMVMMALARSYGYAPSAGRLREHATAVVATGADRDLAVAALAVGWTEDQWGAVGRIPFGCGGRRAIGHTVRQGASCAVWTLARYHYRCADWPAAFSGYNTGNRGCAVNRYGRNVERVRQRLAASFERNP